MRTTFKKIISIMLLIVMVLHILPAMAEGDGEGYYSTSITTDAQLVTNFKIINGEGSTVFVGKSITLSLPDGYGEATWESSNTDIATVANGVVTGVAAGNVEITAVSGERRATTKITMMEAAKDKATIIVQFEKNTIEYDGKEHTIQYTVTCDNDAIDLNKVTYSGTLPSRKDVGAMSVKADSVTFTYEGTEQVDIVVNPGSLRITPREVEVKPQDITVEGELPPVEELQADTAGVVEGDSIEYKLNYVELGDETLIQASGEEKQDNYKVVFMYGHVHFAEPEVSHDELGIDGKRGALAIYEKNKHTALTTTKHSTSGRLVAKDVVVTDGKVLVRDESEAPSIWTISFEDGFYYLKSGGQYLNLNNSAAMSAQKYPVLIEKVNGKLRLLKTDAKTSVNLKSHDVNQGFQASNYTIPKDNGGQGNAIQDNELFEIIPVVISKDVTVAFNTNGAPNGIETLEKEAGDVITLPDYEGEYTGYELSGWKSSVDQQVYGVNEAYTLPNKPGITFTAVWTALKKITFKTNGGDQEAPAAIYVKTSETSVILPEYSGQKTGYELSGWKSSADQQVYKVSEAYTVPAGQNITFTAEWTAMRKITFRNNGGDQEAPAAVYVKADETSIILPEYSGRKTGYELSGWKSSADQQVYKVNEEYTIPEGQNFTFTAEWAALRKITFNANGGNQEAPAVMYLKTGETSITIPEYNGQKDGYAFIGWADVSDIFAVNRGLNHRYHDVYKPGTTYTLKKDQITLYAIYNTTVKFVQFGIRADGVIQDEPNDYSVSSYIGHFKVDTSILKEGRWIIDLDPTKAVNGYYIRNNIAANLNWMPSAEEINEALKKDNVKEGEKISFDPETQYVHYYVLKCTGVGEWKIDGVIRNKASVEITYNTNVPGVERTKIANMPGGYQVTPGKSVLIGSDKNSTEIKTPSRDGYVFQGWNTEADGTGTDYAAGGYIRMTSNLTLYAQWVEAKEEDMVIYIDSDWPKDKPAYAGTQITLTAKLTGFEGKTYTLQWQYSIDGDTWYDEPNANDETFIYEMNETTSGYIWRVIAIDIH